MTTVESPPRSRSGAGAVLADHPRPNGLLAKETLDPLVAAARTGDPRAVEALMALVKPVVARFCRARMGGRDLAYLSADDVAQEVCLAVVKALPGYEDRGGSFLFLVRAIAANKVADAYRVVARERAEPVPELPENGQTWHDPVEHVLTIDLGQRLARLVARLPRTQQEVLALRIVVGLSAVETAEAMGLTPGNVRVSQYRALTRLRRFIAEEDGQGVSS
ncbi:RNA polymerase sigma factor ShbA [Amycolatopsis endophytica]|uniref:RNA polymerase sigma-70 factor (ECF subfamily) n=1 Tax=Amycolatopsis endophytica TaxID=860233 RepID=A0A853BFB1_9PSEU|nr:RNA polymerase sigma factor ShbA [Amycolatopsis endophytica]NYI93267.1 RNA polymerase sigma-70 factor (ECF subfamily) [Amycolatopsis endophytica]